MGSFATVLISRIPNRKSIVFPASHCPYCQQKILWYDNIPIISFILLQGKCRYCQKDISLFYPIIELLSGILFLFIAFQFGIQPLGLIFVVFGFFLIVLSGIDYYHQILPDSLTIPLIFIGLASSPVNFFLGESFKQRLLFSFLGLFVGGGIIYLIGVVGEKIFKKEVIGDGDLKLLAAIGSFLGPLGIFSTLMIGSFLGSVFGGSLILLKRKKYGQPLSFGPFLSFGAMGTIFFSEYLNKLF